MVTKDRSIDRHRVVTQRNIKNFVHMRLTVLYGTTNARRRVQQFRSGLGRRQTVAGVLIRYTLRYYIHIILITNLTYSMSKTLWQID